MQNRNKLLQLLAGNLSNAVVHKVLEESIKEDILRKHYNKELAVSLEIAVRYREKINPADKALPEKDISLIREKIRKRVVRELRLRISKGYKGIDMDMVEEVLESFLKDIRVSQDDR